LGDEVIVKGCRWIHTDRWFTVEDHYKFAMSCQGWAMLITVNNTV